MDRQEQIGHPYRMDKPPALVPPWVERLVARWTSFSGWDWLLVAALLLILAIESAFNQWEYPVADVLTTLAIVALVGVRRRQRVGALLAAVLISTAHVVLSVRLSGGLASEQIGSISIGLSLIVLAYGVFRWASLRWAIGGYVLLILGGLVGNLALGEAALVPDAVSRAISWGLVAAVAMARVYRARFVDQREVQIRLQERQELARELHDVVAHHVSAIAIQAQAAQAVADQNPEAVLRALGAIEGTASLTLTEMRRMVGILRGHDATSTMVGSLTLEDLAEAPGEPAVELSGDPVPSGLPVAVSAAITRIVQESITNARRHGTRGSPIRVDVANRSESVEVRISNQTASNPQNPGGYGLIGMSERAQALQGEFRAGPLPGNRWQVYACLPIDPGQETTR